MLTVVGIVNGCGLGIDTCCENKPNKSKLASCKVLIHCNSQLYLSNKMDTSVIKVDVVYMNVQYVYQGI